MTGKELGNKTKILITDDDVEMRKTLRTILEQEDFEVIEAGDEKEMYSKLESNDPSLIILDIGLPGKDGFTIIKELSPKTDIPIITLTGKTDIIDKVVGLEVGADDYITKPFHNRELTARIKSVLRRSRTKPAKVITNKPDKDTISFGTWTLDLNLQILKDAEGEPTKLTYNEFVILKALIDNAGKPLSRDQLLNYLNSGSRDWDPFDRSLDVLISKIRGKLGDDPALPTYIRTMRQTGYIFIASIAN